VTEQWHAGTDAGPDQPRSTDKHTHFAIISLPGAKRAAKALESWRCSESLGNQPNNGFSTVTATRPVRAPIPLLASPRVSAGITSARTAMLASDSSRMGQAMWRTNEEEAKPQNFFVRVSLGLAIIRCAFRRCDGQRPLPCSTARHLSGERNGRVTGEEGSGSTPVARSAISFFTSASSRGAYRWTAPFQYLCSPRKKRLLPTRNETLPFPFLSFFFFLFFLFLCNRQHDHDNYLATLLLKKQHRGSALAVRAFNVEIARIWYFSLKQHSLDFIEQRQGFSFFDLMVAPFLSFFFFRDTTRNPEAGTAGMRFSFWRSIVSNLVNKAKIRPTKSLKQIPL
jgi:hypothetical protein